MADAVTAAKTRIDRALNQLERRLDDLKSRVHGSVVPTDEDLFAPLDTADGVRLAALEVAGQEASQALAAAAEAIRDVLAQAQVHAQPDADTDDLPLAAVAEAG